MVPYIQDSVKYELERPRLQGSESDFRQQCKKGPRNQEAMLANLRPETADDAAKPRQALLKCSATFHETANLSSDASKAASLVD
jgi:hypothetical protein